jgi:hypothetical protein
MTPQQEISRVRRLLKRGQRRIRQIVTFNRRRRRRLKHLREALAPRFGVDFAWGRPSAAAMKAVGVSFVCRYLSFDTTGKSLTAAEARAYSAAGLDLVTVWETTADRALAGEAAGEADAKLARAMATKCGQPTHRPIYFAVDLETTAHAVAPYFRGVAKVLGPAGAGVYGSYTVCSGLLGAHIIDYAWQTYAWSGGAWFAGAHLQQFSNGHKLDGIEVDYDRSTAPDFGQWRVAG